MSRNLKIIISFIILLIGLFIFSSEYLNAKKIEVYDYMNELYYKDTVSINTDILNETATNEQIENKEDIKVDTDYSFKDYNDESLYVGYLSIPKINLKKGFTNIDSNYNNVNKNIQILNSSDYPDKENGNVILASHSGNSSVSYFKDLYQLNKGDLVYIEYNNINYTYKIVNIYTVLKTGQVEVIRNKDISTLTLITCTKNDKTTQTVYISELINKE